MDNYCLGMNMISDGLGLSPAEYGALLHQLTAGGDIAADNYGAGGCVAEFEREMAEILGKPAAVIMPTGTMTNLLAVEYLARTNPKVIVQSKSHLYNDCGDCAAQLARLQLVPLSKSATISLEDIEAEIHRAGEGKVRAPVGVISIESPVRRLDGEMFDFETMGQVAGLARDNAIALHLDGARLPVAAAYTGRPMAAYASLFDTVYVSLYKGFNSLSGGVLAGDDDCIDRLRHWRRRNGGGMAQLWPIAVVAQHFLPGFVGRLEEAIEISEEFFKLLREDQRFEHIAVKRGSSVSRVLLPGLEKPALDEFHQRLATSRIHLPPAAETSLTFTIKVNDSWRQTTPDILYSAFDQAATAIN